ncbi:MAG: carbohydrate binding family 9 domain-containing protein [Gemmatimonadota bacterium]|nr:carbohydrate binding family 9 domain-containing protein [Gemmatimonadota bacterium]
MLLAFLLLLYSGLIDPPTRYDGRAGRLAVQVPRLEVEPAIDGKLDEPVWGEAALLTGFSQFSPADGVPAADSTEILVWYSPTAILFGIRAFEAHGAVHATLADRDRIASDDHVQIMLSTFDDGRQASVFAVNPFGVQSDGALVETGSTSGNGFNNNVVRREKADLSPDFVFASKGRVTEYGYEVEVRIPFKSLRFQPKAEQSWGMNIVRLVQHSGHEDSWAPAKRASASFLAQSGRLVGLKDLRRGVVLDITPSITSRSTGTRAIGGWDYAGGSPELGGTVRWGITNNLTLNGTGNPDFSQVESDVQEFAFDPRQEIFFSEKRPFFLDGVEQFNTPNLLIYARRIVQPVAAAKLTGKAFGTDLALLTAVDDRAGSATGEDHPVYNLLRVQRDIGSQSRLGLVYTDKIDGDNYNRVAGADARLVFGAVYSAQLQLAGSRTRTTHHGSPMAGEVCGKRPHLRVALHHHRHRRGLSGSKRIHLAARDRPRHPEPPGHRLRKEGRIGRKPHRRRDTRRHLAVRPVRSRGRHPGSEAALQCQHHAARRVAGRWVGSGGVLRLSGRRVFGLRHRAAPERRGRCRHGVFHRHADDSQPRLRALAGYAGVLPLFW